MLWVNNTAIATDQQGYLEDHQQWSEDVALAIALAEALELTAEHWEVIRYVRQFYLDFNRSPSMRPLVKYLRERLGAEKGNSLYLALLFPGGVAKQSTKIAGLPKPARCI